jgi:predicted MFS family arabinose efflux permease
MKNKNTAAGVSFSAYQKFAIAILAITQFTVVLDFMVMSPLGDMLIKSLSLTPSQFGFAVSAYAFSAGAAGLLTAGFADKYDRKKLLLFFYCGFIVGTVFCGLANSFVTLMAARIVTGLFGGVIGAISMAIVTDVFSLQQRGRVMGFVQMGLGVSQVLGIPVGLYLANAWGWQAPFMAIAALSFMIALLIMIRMQPVTEHLAFQKEHNAFRHLVGTVAKKEYRMAFTAMALLSLGGFMMMPFSSAYAINNLHVTQQQLPLIFMISGIGTLFIMPAVGKLSDKVDKFKLFTAASLWMGVMVVVYTNIPALPLWIIIALNIMMTIGIMGRFIPAGALTTAIPDMKDRGAFMSVSSSLQQVSGGVAAAFAGLVVVQKDQFSPLEHYNILGYIIVVILAICVFMVYRVKMMVERKAQAAAAPANIVPEPAEEPVL